MLAKVAPLTNEPAWRWLTGNDDHVSGAVVESNAVFVNGKEIDLFEVAYCLGADDPLALGLDVLEESFGNLIKNEYSIPLGSGRYLSEGDMFEVADIA